MYRAKEQEIRKEKKGKESNNPRENVWIEEEVDTHTFASPFLFDEFILYFWILRISNNFILLIFQKRKHRKLFSIVYVFLNI